MKIFKTLAIIYLSIFILFFVILLFLTIQNESDDFCKYYTRTEQIPYYEFQEKNITIDVNGINISINLSSERQKVTRFKICQNDSLIKMR